MDIREKRKLMVEIPYELLESVCHVGVGVHGGVWKLTDENIKQAREIIEGFNKRLESKNKNIGK